MNTSSSALTNFKNVFVSSILRQFLQTRIFHGARTSGHPVCRLDITTPGYVLWIVLLVVRILYLTRQCLGCMEYINRQQNCLSRVGNSRFNISSRQFSRWYKSLKGQKKYFKRSQHLIIHFAQPTEFNCPLDAESGKHVHPFFTHDELLRSLSNHTKY